MAKSDLTDDEILAKIQQAESASYGIYDQELTADRAEAFRFYNGENVLPAPEGRSQVVSRDVLDVIESALPQLLKVFVSGDEVVRFDARGPEDEEAAEQETAAVNYFTLEKNDGFNVFYVWFKDALLSKNGYVKVWYEENEEVENESYQGLTDDQMTQLIQDEKVTVLEHTAYPDEIALQQLQQQMAMATQQGQPVQPPAVLPQLHDVKIQVKEIRGCIEIENVAPEDILVGQDTRTVSLQEANFVQHRALMDKAEIEENGWEVPEGVSEESVYDSWEESNARDLYGESDVDSQIRKYIVKDTYFRIEGELKRYVIIGNEIVYREDAEIVPFACITPHIMPHRHIGMSYADLTKDIQLIKSTLIRGQLDGMYLSLQPRFAISDRVSLEDMLTSRPGGVVRVQGEPTTAILPLQTPQLPPASFTLVEYLDAAKERRTGVTSYNQGLDANSLNKTATGVNQIMQAAQQRIELVARTFANTGVKELFMLVHRLVRKYYTRPEIIRLQGKWVSVDPREWKERKDLSVSVGLGTGNRDTQLMHLMTILQAQKEAIQIGIATPKNIYNALTKLTQNAGFKSPEEFWTDPEMNPQPPSENPLITVEKIKQQGEVQKFQAQAQVDQQKAQAEMQQEQVRSQNDVAIEQAKIQAQMELERWKAELDAQTALQKARLDAEAKIAIEQVKAANQPAPAQVSVNNDPNGDFSKSLEGMMQRSEQNQQMMLQAIVEALSRPKSIVRGPDGRAVGVQ